MHDPGSSSQDPPPLLVAVPPVLRRIGPIRWLIHLLIIAAYPIGIGVLSWRGGAQRGPVLSADPAELLLVCARELLIFGVVFGLAWLASRATKDDLMLRWRNGLWPVPLGIGYSVALRLAVAIVFVAVAAMLVATRVVSMETFRTVAEANRPKVETLVDVPALQTNPIYFVLSVTVVSFVLGGLREEIWRSAFLAGMRGLWPRGFGSKAGQVGAAALAAVLFGFGHLPQGLLAVGMTGLLGFGLGVIMVLHRSIWPAVIAHGMFDATTFALLPAAAEILKSLSQPIGP